jgi:hypothetical protein
VQQESAAADSGRLRLDEAEHHLHRDRGVDRAAAGAQDFEACVRCVWICRDDDLPRSEDGRFFFLPVAAWVAAETAPRRAAPRAGAARRSDAAARSRSGATRSANDQQRDDVDGS